MCYGVNAICPCLVVMTEVHLFLNSQATVKVACTCQLESANHCYTLRPGLRQEEEEEKPFRLEQQLA